MQPVAAAQQDSHAQLGAAAPAADAQLLGLDRDIRGVTHALTAGANLADWRPYQPIGKAATAIRKQRRAERRARQQQEELEQWMAWQLEYEEQQQQLDPTMRAEYSRPVSSEVPEGLHGECVVLFETFTPKAQEEAFKWLEEQPDAVYALLQPPSP
jgi:hypothetical protein